MGKKNLEKQQYFVKLMQQRKRLPPPEKLKKKFQSIFQLSRLFTEGCMGRGRGCQNIVQLDIRFYINVYAYVRCTCMYIIYIMYINSNPSCIYIFNIVGYCGTFPIISLATLACNAISRTESACMYSCLCSLLLLTTIYA